MKEKPIVVLDKPDARVALELIDQLDDEVSNYKIETVGADYLAVSRSITASREPKAALARLFDA